MLLSYSFAALSVATSLVSARPLFHYRRQSTIMDFGSCNATPDIIFALGLDGRKDPSFQAKNNNVFNHGSALGIGVITSFICQQLNDKCKAPAATLAACSAGQASAAKVTGGGAADAFNAAFGITTAFGSSGANAGAGAASTSAAATSSAAETSAVSETPTATSSTPTDAASTCAAATTVTVTVEPTAVASTPCPTDPVTVTVTGSAPTATPTDIVAAITDTSSMSSATETSAAATETSSSAAPPAATGAASSLDFGSCTNPTIEFGPAFEGRKAAEFSNKPVNKNEFPQASALNVNIVTRAICDILASKCKAPQATLDACKKGQDAAAAVTAGSGAGADAFNSALGIKTDFTNIPAAPGGGPGSAALATTPNFGQCSNPTIEFGAGFDGRTENSFQPKNNTDFNHGSALNPQIIITSICDTLVNTCNANKPALDQCKAAQAATTGLTGQAVADAFNAAVLKGVA